jgi:methyl-accepting chemotaxis protein
MQGSGLLNRLSLKSKMALLLGLSLAALTLVGAGGWLGISRIHATTTLIGEQKLPASIILGNLRGQTAALLQYVLEVSNRGDDATAQESFKKALEQKRQARAALAAAIADFEKTTMNADEQDAWKQFVATYAPWQKIDDKVNDYIGQLGGNTDEDMHNTLFQQYKGATFDWVYELDKMNRALTRVLDANLQASQQARGEAGTARDLAVRIMAVVYGLSIAVSLALSFLIVASITRPLERLRRAIVAIAQDKDFTRRVEGSGRDEAAQTAQAFNELLAATQTSLAAVLTSAERIAELSGEASQASDRVSDASEQQSEAATAMAAAVGELTASVEVISGNMRDALTRAADAGASAGTGRTLMQSARDEMERIAATVTGASRTIDELGGQSQRISAIMQVIQDVADQTNLLALNAAIEAARAGESGRGFAVVADEVRKLAERTRKSADEISGMIAAMQQASNKAVHEMDGVMQLVAAGAQLSQQTAERMAHIEHGVQRVSEATRGISDSVGEQGAATRDISQRIDAVARMSEGNSVAAAETAKVSHELTELSASLIAAMNKFRL